MVQLETPLQVDLRAQRAEGASDTSVICCTACGRWSAVARNPRGCGTCASLERHRVLAVLIPALYESLSAGLSSRGALVLDVAPTTALEPTLARLSQARVLRMDFDPGADSRIVDVQSSLTDLPLPEGSVDLLLCSHVLEHIPDDASAMREIARVLAPGGIGVVLVPRRPGVTDEDPSASEAERVRRFGQADHVRYYGDDFEERLTDAGLVQTHRAAAEYLPPWVIAVAKLAVDEEIWLVRRESDKPIDLLDLAEEIERAFQQAVHEAGQRMVTEAVELRAQTLAADAKVADITTRADRRSSSHARERQRLVAEIALVEKEIQRLRSRRAVRLLHRVDRINSVARSRLRRRRARKG